MTKRPPAGSVSVQPDIALAAEDLGSELLTLRGVSKAYGGVQALRGVNFCLSAPGVIHGLIGENGSGKSTLLGVLSGQVHPDAGTIHIDDHRVSFSTPADALAHGIAMVSQETAVAPDLTVAENVLMGRRLVRGPLGLRWRAIREQATEVLSRLNLDYDPNGRVRLLRPDQRQMVEIARALSTNARILILDEPTSSLADDQVAALFSAVHRVAANGVAVIFVSHRVPELFGLVEDLTVLRDGQIVASAPAATFTAATLVAAMVGTSREPTALLDRRPGSTRSAALAVSGLTSGDDVRDITLTVGRGEIVGLAGLAGAGRSELLEAIFGLRPIDAGHIVVSDKSLWKRNPRMSADAGLGFLPPDRRHQGLVLSMSVKANMTMARTRNRPRLRRPQRALETDLVSSTGSAMRLKAASQDVAVATLSGGNQQKVALGKWLAIEPSVLLLDEPTRGVDIAAKGEIHGLLARAAAQGMGLLVSSSENEELLALCDRVLVLHRGRIVDDLNTSNTTEHQLAHSIGGQS